MVTLSKKLKNAAQVAIKNDDKRKVLQNIYMDPCYIYMQLMGIYSIGAGMI